MYLSPLLLTLLSAVLFYLSFPNCISMYGFWPCIWFFAVPLLLAMRDKPLKERLGVAVFWGLCAHGLLMQGLMAISPAGFFTVVLGFCQPVIFACFFRSTGRSWKDIFYFPLLWSISELLRNSLLGGFSFYISHALAFCPAMLGLYSHLGCLGMSFVIFGVNTFIYLGVVHKKGRFNFILAAGLIFLGVVLAGLLNKTPALPTARHLRISVIQANISPLEKMDPDLFDRNAALHLSLTEQAYIKARPDLVIWPETAFPDDLLQSAQWQGPVFKEAAHMNADLLLGIAPIIDGKEYNSALLINARGVMAGLYHKQALVPFAETTPLAAWGINWGRGYHITPGNKPGIFALSRVPLLFGVVICSESAHPALVRQLKRAGAKFLVEISNDGWFIDKASYMLHAEAAVMRAAENRMWVIRAANTGFSFAVGPDGVIHTDANLKLGRKGFGIFDIMVNDP